MQVIYLKVAYTLETTVSIGKKKRARKGDLARTWLREVDERIQQLVVKKLDATLSGPWEYKEETGDWEETTASLVKNLGANGIALEEDVAGMLRVL
jgi:hypothetical protein